MEREMRAKRKEEIEKKGAEDRERQKKKKEKAKRAEWKRPLGQKVAIMKMIKEE
jgi:hypothetical protein